MTEENNNKVTEQIELLTELMKVTSAVKNNVTQDYTLAFFGKSEREFITENYQNAEFAKEMVSRFGQKGYHYEWDEKVMDWKRNEDGSFRKIPITKEDRDIIEKMAIRIFTYFMISPHMMAILNRNKTENFLVKLLGKQDDKEEPVVYSGDDRSLLQKIKDKLSGDKEERFEEE